jgi:hypothetical protein
VRRHKGNDERAIQETAGFVDDVGARRRARSQRGFRLPEPLRQRGRRRAADADDRDRPLSGRRRDRNDGVGERRRQLG